jgi:chromosome segregation ATPase
MTPLSEAHTAMHEAEQAVAVAQEKLSAARWGRRQVDVAQDAIMAQLREGFRQDVDESNVVRVAPSQIDELEAQIQASDAAVDRAQADFDLALTALDEARGRVRHAIESDRCPPQRTSLLPPSPFRSDVPR